MQMRLCITLHLPAGEQIVRGSARSEDQSDRAQRCKPAGGLDRPRVVSNRDGDRGRIAGK